MFSYVIQKGLFSYYMQCRLLITFAKSVVPDLGRQNVGPGLASNCLNLSNGIPEIYIFFKKIDFKTKISRRQESI